MSISLSRTWNRWPFSAMKHSMYANIVMRRLNAVNTFPQFIRSMDFVLLLIHITLMTQIQSEFLPLPKQIISIENFSNWINLYNNFRSLNYFNSICMLLFFLFHWDISTTNFTSYLKPIKNGHYFSHQNVKQKSLFIRIWRILDGIFDRTFYGSRILLLTCSYQWSKHIPPKMRSNYRLANESASFPKSSNWNFMRVITRLPAAWKSVASENA